MPKCGNCNQELKEGQKRWSACGCLLGEMRCSKCGELVKRTGWDSDGFGIYRHDPCGLVCEDECSDPRLEPVVG